METIFMILAFLSTGLQLVSFIYGIKNSDIFSKPFYGYAIWGILVSQLFIYLARNVNHI